MSRDGNNTNNNNNSGDRPRSAPPTARYMHREDSLTDEDAVIDVNLPPGRMHAVKGQHRLQGSAGNLNYFLEHGMLSGGGYNTNTSGSGSAPGTPRSRSRSPSMRATMAGMLSGGGSGNVVDGSGTTGKVTLTTADGNSSISSFDDYLSDKSADILTDRAGLLDDLSESQRKLSHSGVKELHMPPTVNERMTEDTLEDIHAFSDVVRSSNCSRVSVVSGSNGEGMLEPLDECEEGLEEEDSLDGNDDHDDPEHLPGGAAGGFLQPRTATVILTNMENLTIHADDDDSAAAQRNGGGDATAASESLLGEEAPTEPTA